MSEKSTVMRYEVDCPGCDSKIVVKDGLTPGVYGCFCGLYKLQLSWSQFNEQFKVPVLTVAANEERCVSHDLQSQNNR